jgi:hypothetical protein
MNNDTLFELEKRWPKMPLNGMEQRLQAFVIAEMTISFAEINTEAVVVVTNVTGWTTVKSIHL